ncbi:PepSY-associated TM helix domain-containing protein [Kangiella shandongensis]|uniref:PepSY-associated TM helix domain-containing protein n=1 Tax=Kangiella shandongensis TaxID=2763258 RepID=UPI001CBE7491|nr:PepSY-associated TM helix domain-containing protein [Kangiella shandongensis]
MAIKNRRLWFQVHGWLSLPIWILFSFICLTGTIAVLSHELTWLTNPNARANNPQQLEAKPVYELVDVVKEEIPDAKIQGVMVLEPYLVTPIRFSSKDHPVGMAYINQYTGEIQEINNGFTFVEFMRSLHGWLLFPWQEGYSIGYYLVSLMSLVTLGALITGLVVYKKFWKSFTQPRLRRKKGARTFFGDFHRLSGVWSIWFLMVMGVTGLCYFIQAIGWHNGSDVWDEPEAVMIQQVPTSQNQKAVPQRISLEAAMHSAEQVMPGFEPSYIAMPEHHRGHFTIMGSGGEVFYDSYSHQAYVNPWTGTVEELRQPDTMNGLQTIVHITDPLHYGTLGGIWTKILWFFFGLLLSMMSISGFVIYSKRTVKSPKKVKSKTLQEELANG